MEREEVLDLAIAVAPVILILGVLIASAALGKEPPRAHYRHHGAMLLPDPTVTPGEMGALTPAQLCDPKFRTGTVRDVPESEKKAACAEYGVTPCDGHVELDHLVDLWGGGANNIRNLWPQPMVQARLKDTLEKRLHKMACAGDIGFPEAAKEIEVDWYAAYQKYVAARQ